jgi:hypothetical protein
MVATTSHFAAILPMEDTGIEPVTSALQRSLQHQDLQVLPPIQHEVGADRGADVADAPSQQQLGRMFEGGPLKVQGGHEKADG